MHIRPYENNDRDAVRRICADTADYGQPIERVFPGREWISDAVIEGYLRFYPDLVFVAEEAGSVAGYLTGCTDTRAYLRQYARRLSPTLVGSFLWRGLFLRWTAWRFVVQLVRQARWHGRAWFPVLDAYPAHCHINLRADISRGGVGTQLLTAYLDILRAKHVPGIHISTGTGPGKAFFAKHGFVTLATHPGMSRPQAPAPEVWIMGKTLTNPA